MRVTRAAATALLVLLMADGSVRAQAPTGAITGVVTDASDAVLTGVPVTVVNRDTGLGRTVTTSAEGRYSAEALPPGLYQVTAEATGFKKVVRVATVEAGTTTTADLALELGEVSETVTVSNAAPLLRYEHHQVGGIVTREQIENLPLNGRNFLELAKLEPGVTNVSRATNNRTLVPVLGAGLQTVPRIGYTSVTVDGGSIIFPNTIGSGMQVSQEVVQEFQISTVNFDAATKLTSNGAINIVTRSGGSSYRGNGFFFYREAMLTLGEAGTSAFTGKRHELTDSLVWQKRMHRLRAGFDWEHSTTTDCSINNDQAQIMLFSPEQARRAGISVPASFTTLDDLLQLPLRSFTTSVGPGTVLEEGFGPDRIRDVYRLFVSDTWRAGSRLTVNGGLGWSYEPNALNNDLSKPVLLTPILGADGLKPAAVQRANFSPTLGIAWTATADGRTVVRAGAGRYYDPIGSTNYVDLTNERVALLPLGTGRLTRSGANIELDGHMLDFLVPSSFTGAHLMQNLRDIRSRLAASLNPNNRDFAVRTIDQTKEAPTNLIDPAYQTPYAVHVSAGVQRELAQNIVVSADLVWRRFTNAFIPGIDYNRWLSASGPVIPRCLDSQKEDLLALCSNGQIKFSNTSGRARYKGLLLRAEKRLSHRTQFLVSYALGSWTGTNGTGTGAGFNNDNWLENDGPLPTDVRHALNLSGLVELPWQWQVAASVSAYGRPPFSAFVGNADFNGDGTQSDLLPGTTVNQLGRGIDEADLKPLVERSNQQHPATPLTLPDTYAFNDNFFTQDVRLTRVFVLGPGKTRVSLFAEVFNLLNTANLVGYGRDITAPATFGQPNNRTTQVFGSGGPRAFQLGARVSF